MAPLSLRGAHWAPVAPAKDGPFFRSLLLSAWLASARELGCQEPDQVPSCPPPRALLPWPGPVPHTHSQVARYHWWKSCSLVAPFLLRFCPGTSSTQAGTE